MSRSTFEAVPGGRNDITVSASSQRVALNAGNGMRSDVRVVNHGTAKVAIRFGDSTVTADFSTDMTVAAGVTEVLKLSGTHVAAIAAGATGVIEFTPGTGF
jgi:hypothetical protein